MGWLDAHSKTHDSILFADSASVGGMRPPVVAAPRLFKGMDQKLGVLVAILGGVMPATINFFNVASNAGALMVVLGAGLLSVFDRSQRKALFNLRLQDHEDTAAEILWGFGSFRSRSLCTGRVSWLDSSESGTS